MATPTLGIFLQRLKQSMSAEALASRSDAELIEQFRAHRDDAAFRAILDRHGPMVFQVCRRVLDSQADIEDAFQATFLILVRRGHTIRRSASLGSWLHGVAHRTALKLRTQSNRRRMRELKACGPELVDGKDDITWRELRGILDEELQRLPQTCRAPLVLCYLEGLTQDEAAKQLRLHRSALRRQLDRGREMLGRRLARRGVALGTVLAARLLSDCAQGAGIPRTLFLRTTQSIIHAATKFAAPAGELPPRVAALTEGVIKTMHYAKCKSVAGMLACCLALAVSAYQISPKLASAQDGKPSAKSSAPLAMPDIEPIDANLVFDEEVQKQLRLSPNQIRQLTEARDKGGAAVADESKRITAIDQRIKELQQEIDRLQREREQSQLVIDKSQSEQVKTAIPKVLSRDAVQELRQITLQRMQLSDVLLNAKIRAKLDLNDEQVKKIQELVENGDRRVGIEYGTRYLAQVVKVQADTAHVWKTQVLWDRLSDTSRAELLKILNPKQREELERLSGMTFEKTK
jgi:RNA polymerase sigma factor (sigma-70 family)